MKDKLVGSLGCVGMILYYAIGLIVSVLPFIMIDVNFFVNFIFILVSYFFPLITPIFWIWGLVCAIKGVQDFLAIMYYVVFVILWVPYYINIILSFLRKNK